MNCEINVALVVMTGNDTSERIVVGTQGKLTDYNLMAVADIDTLNRRFRT